MFEVFRTLFLLNECVAHDWACERAFADAQLIGAVRDRYRLAAAPSPTAGALYESIADAIADHEPDIAFALCRELDRRLHLSLDPTGLWTTTDERVFIAPRRTSDHPHDYWVVHRSDGSHRAVEQSTAARFDPASGSLLFTPGAAPFDPPWRILPGTRDIPPMWLRAQSALEAEHRGWLHANHWLDPDAARTHALDHETWALPRAPIADSSRHR